jgi:hypothetical protein
MNLNPAVVCGFECHLCGGDLGEHEFKQTPLMPDSKAYAIDSSKITNYSGEQP